MDWGAEDFSEVDARDAFSRELKALQAKVAALLGPSPAGLEDFRKPFGSLSLDLPDRKVVLMVYLSGLGL
jgi:hypothetical protein